MNIEDLRRELNLKKAKLKVLEIEISDISRQISEHDYPLVTWEEAEQAKLRHKHDNIIAYRPDFYHVGFISLTHDNEMIIGGYYYNDHIKRGSEMRIHRSFLK